jgi:hypothetical protein
LATARWLVPFERIRESADQSLQPTKAATSAASACVDHVVDGVTATARPASVVRTIGENRARIILIVAMA